MDIYAFGFYFSGGFIYILSNLCFKPVKLSNENSNSGHDDMIKLMDSSCINDPTKAPYFKR